MRLFLVAAVFLVGTATEYRRPRENQFQIQGVIIEDPPTIYRFKRQQFKQPFYRQQSQPPPYLERPAPPSYFQQRPLPPAPPKFQKQNFRQQQPVSPSQQPFQRAPSPQPQYQQRQSFPQYLSPQPPQQQYRPPQPQPTFSQSQSWTPNKRIFNEVSNSAPEPSRYNTENGQTHNGQDGQRGGVDVNGDFNGARYYYPPRQPFPLPKCFHNPTGYVCCNQQLNDLIVETYSELEKRPKFHTCNVNALAFQIQQRAERHFNHTFETIAAYDDFAQKIHFNGDFVCKVELGGKYMLAYATVSQAMDDTLRPIPSHHAIPQLEAPIHLSRRSNVMFI